MKTCKRCGIARPFAEFAWVHSKRRPPVLDYWCRGCRRIYHAEWRRANSEQHRAKHARWAKAHPERVREISAKWYRAHRAHGINRSGDYYRRNRDRIRAYSASWRRANRDRRLALNQQRRARSLSAPGRGISARERRHLMKDSLGICVYCNGRKPLAVDHIEPLNFGGSHDPDNAVACCNNCNSSKNATTLLVWLAKRAAMQQHVA